MFQPVVITDGFFYGIIKPNWGGTTGTLSRPQREERVFNFRE